MRLPCTLLVCLVYGGGLAWAGADTSVPVHANGTARILILPFRVDPNVAKEQVGAYIATILVADASENKARLWDVVDADQIRKQLDSDEFRGQDFDDDLITKLARRVGARYVVMGTLGTSGLNSSILYSRKIDVQDLRVERPYIEVEDVHKQDLLKRDVEALGYRLGLRKEKPDPPSEGQLDVQHILNAIQPPADAQNVRLTVTMTALGGAPSKAAGKTYQTVYQEGEEIAVEITANRDCYATLLYLPSGSKEPYVLLPNARMPNTVQLKGGVAYRVPQAEVSQARVPRLHLTSGPPYGASLIKVIVTGEPLTIEGLQAAGLKMAPVAIPLHKGITIGKQKLPAKVAGLFEACKQYATAEVTIVDSKRK